MRENIKKILNKPVWGGRREGDKVNPVAEENRRLVAALKEQSAEIGRLKAALRACWKLCRDGEHGGQVTEIVISTLSGGDGEARTHCRKSTATRRG